MSRQLLPLLGAAAGGLAAAVSLPMASAYADDCTLGECTLVSGGPPTDVTYSGIRPLFTDWQDTQPVNVDVTQGASSFVSGSYDVSEQDYQSSLMDNAIYQYSGFTPATTNPSGIDSDGLSGVSVHDFSIGPGAGVNAAGQPTYLFNDLNVLYPSGAHTEVTTLTGEFTNFLVNNGTASGDWIELAGQSTPTMLWDSLATDVLPNLPNVLPPDLWFPNVAEMFPAGLF